MGKREVAKVCLEGRLVAGGADVEDTRGVMVWAVEMDRDGVAELTMATLEISF